MHMILFGLTPNTADFIFGKKKVLVNHANDLTINDSAIFHFQRVKFVYWSLLNRGEYLDDKSSYILDGYNSYFMLS